MKKTLEWTHPALHLVQKALMAAVTIIVAVGLFVSPVTAFAENASTTDLTAPTHEKTVTDNGDGTYKITPVTLSRAQRPHMLMSLLSWISRVL